MSNLFDSGTGSLRAAILEANTASGADIIDATGVTGSISLLTALLTIAAASSTGETISLAGSVTEPTFERLPQLPLEELQWRHLSR